MGGWTCKDAFSRSPCPGLGCRVLGAVTEWSYNHPNPPPAAFSGPLGIKETNSASDAEQYGYAGSSYFWILLPLVPPRPHSLSGKRCFLRNLRVGSVEYGL